MTRVVVSIWLRILLLVLLFTSQAKAASVARTWNDQILQAIREDFPNPAVHARNLFHLSVAMWDAWVAYDTGTAVAYIHREEATAADLAAARHEAISYAGYRILKSRYTGSVNGATTVVALDFQMASFGYDPSLVTEVGDLPSALGNRVGAAVLAFADTDLSRESAGYRDFEYFVRNAPLGLLLTPQVMINPNRWQPLAFEVAFTQNGQQASKVQSFLSSHWRDVRPFAMRRPSTSALYHDPGLPPQLGGATDAEFKAGNVEVIQLSNLLDPGLGAMINISPSAYGNNTLGQNDGTGHAINPATGAAYPPNVVNHGDLGRVLAEFWADGPESETPPGHWNVLANEVVEHPDFERRWQGTGPIMDELEWDVKMYLALNGAVHDAAIAAWENKREYDYVRPISSIRHMGLRGQFSDPNGPSYHEEGLPLIPGLIEVVTSASFASGERHAHVVSRDGVTSVIGKMAIHCWIGEPDEPTTTFSGVGWILAEDWFPYQRDTFVTPAFAGYVSGHSAFSRAAAEVLTRLTGSAFFPGGMGTFTANKDAYLRFEVGPSQTVQLQWATYYDAADEAGISRLYGGIHVPVDDGPGRIIGSACGIEAWDMASHYFDGTVFTQDFNAAGDLMTEQDFEVTWETVPGVSYQVQTSPDCREYTDVGESIVADGTTESYTISLGATGVDRFFVRVIRNTP